MTRVIRYADLVETPWKNGGGMMREIARGGPAGPAPWQLSRASVVRNGPFSRFDGLVRVLTVVAGTGLSLRVGATRVDADPLAPFRFDGGAGTEAFLRDGPVSPFNLIFDPGLCDGRVEVLRGPLERELTASPARLLAVHSVGGGVRLERHPLDPDDTALLDTGSTRIVLTDEAVALLVTLDMADTVDAHGPGVGSR